MKNRFLGILIACLFLSNTSNVFSQDAYLGDIKLTAITFAQRDWMECNGQLLQISQYQSLFALLGTTYGGDGRTTFALPDLRSRVPVHNGQGIGLTNYFLGQKGGSESIKLTADQLPAHSHGVAVNTDAGTTSDASNGYLAHSGNLDKEYSSSKNTTNQVMVQPTGNGNAIENRQPYLVMRYVICVNGLFPSRP